MDIRAIRRRFWNGSRCCVGMSREGNGSVQTVRHKITEHL